MENTSSRETQGRKLIAATMQLFLYSFRNGKDEEGMKFKTIIKTINLKKVKISTWVRLLMVVIALINYLLKEFDLVPPVITENQVYNVVISIFTVVSFLQAYWKNNSFTEAAQEADSYFNLLKDDYKEE